jgi:NAD(P)H-dependent FMN reductase
MDKIGFRGVEKEIVDLRQYKLPFCNGSQDYPDFPDVKRFRETIKNCHGVVIASPEYHGIMSGVLKNALDLLSEEHVEGKIFGLMVVMGGASNSGSLDALRIVCRQLHAWVIPEQLIVSYAEKAFDDNHCFVDPLLDQRLDKLVGQLIDAIDKFRTHF